jgi:TolB-like protein/Flp pilus assembly protein TadD
VNSHSTAGDSADQPKAPAPSSFARWLAKLKHVKTGVMAVAGVGAVLSGLVGYYTTYKTVSGGSPAQVASTTPAAPLSILVLPFANQTGDAQKAYIADALTASISADLNRIRDVFVVPTTTAFTFKDKALSMQQLGQAAGVRFVLQGNVLASGEKLRISVQLSDAQSGAQLWNDTFEGELGKLFELQDLVTARARNSIGPEMVVVAARDSARRANSPKVADLMLRARALRLQRRQSLDTYARAEKLLREVLALDPGNATAMADLSSTLALHGYNFMQLGDPEQDKLVAEGRDWALRAKALDPDLPSIYIALGVYAVLHNDLEGGRRMVEEQLARDPKNWSAYINMSSAYIYGGAPQRAQEALKQALALYPKGTSTLFTNLAESSLMLGDNDAAVGWAQKAVDLDPGYFIPYTSLAIAYANQGDMAKAQQYAAEYKRLALVAGIKTGIDAQVLPAGLSPAYTDYYKTRYVPQWKNAGLP